MQREKPPGVASRTAVGAVAHFVTVTIAVALAYFAVGKLALLLAIPPCYATAVWPSAGIALAAA